MINKGYLTAKTDKPSDEYYTPRPAVLPIIKYINPLATVWCPFDTEESQYVQCFRERGIKTIATHIDSGQNFFFYEPVEKYDLIVSNPPFSCKDAILHRLTELGKPYAMLLPLPTLQGQGRFDDLKNSEAPIFDKRINYYQDIQQTVMAKGVAFASIYICHGVLPEKLIFERL